MEDEIDLLKKRDGLMKIGTWCVVSVWLQGFMKYWYSDKRFLERWKCVDLAGHLWAVPGGVGLGADVGLVVLTPQNEVQPRSYRIEPAAPYLADTANTMTEQALGDPRGTAARFADSAQSTAAPGWALE